MYSSKILETHNRALWGEGGGRLPTAHVRAVSDQQTSACPIAIGRMGRRRQSNPEPAVMAAPVHGSRLRPGTWLPAGGT